MGSSDPWISCRNDTIAVISEIEQGNKDVTVTLVSHDIKSEEVEENNLNLSEKGRCLAPGPP